MARYNLNDRPMPGGSMDPRLHYRAEKELNTKLGPALPRPLVRETSTTGAIGSVSNDTRRRKAGLASRFIKD